MRLLPLVAAAAALATPAAAAAPATSLTITVWPKGSGASVTHTLRCGPVGGTLPRARDACARLARLDDPFAPWPPDSICIQRFYGPQRALVRGRHDGRSYWVRLARRDGCEEGRWQRHAFLLRTR